MTTDCQQALELIHDRLDGLLGAADDARLDEHLADCEACRDAAADLEALLSETARLSKTLEPRRDLWPGVELRLGSAGWRRRHKPIWRSAPLMAAAAALVALALGVWLGRGGPAPRVAEEPELATPGAGSLGEETRNHARAELARFEDGTLLTRQDLLAAVQSHSDRLSPETVAAVEENMRIIDQAIGQIRAALEEDPLNQRLNMLLAAQYQQEVELLKRVSGV